MAEQGRAADKGEVKVTLKRSLIGRKPAHRASARGLGLKRIGQTVTLQDTPEVRGMIRQVDYLVQVEGDA